MAKGGFRGGFPGGGSQMNMPTTWRCCRIWF